jgi:hypothetical protein
MMEYLPDVNGDYKINISWTQNHGLEFLALSTGPDIPIFTNECPLVNATNREGTNITQRLLYEDHIYTDLWPGEEIILEFQPAIEEQDGFVRDYMMTTKGYYVTLRSVGVFQEVDCSISLNGGMFTEADALIVNYQPLKELAFTSVVRCQTRAVIPDLAISEAHLVECASNVFPVAFQCRTSQYRM